MTDFIVANFTGTGTLSAYTPDVGGAFTAPKTGNIPDGTFDHTQGNTGMLAYMTRVNAGSINLIMANPWGDDYFLQSPATPPSANYYMESVLLLDPTKTINAYVSHCHRGIRGVSGEASVFDCLYVKFNVDETDHTHRRVSTCYSNYQTNLAAATSVSTSDTTVLPLPIVLGANSSVTLRSEFEGNAIRMFVDGVLVKTAVIAGTYLSGAGKCAWSFQFSTGGTYSNEAYDSLKAGDSFIPPPPGSFWQDFVKSVEGTTTFRSADPQTAPYVAPELPPAVVPLVGDFFVDNFNGTGNLSTHMPDVGGAYSGGPSAAVLDGAGRLPFGNGWTAFNYVAPSSPFVLEARLTIVNNPPNGFNINFGCTGVINGYTLQYYIDWDGSAYSTDCYLFNDPPLVGDIVVLDQFHSYPDTGLAADALAGPIVLRVEVGPGIKWYRNGVLLHSSAAVAPALSGVFFSPRATTPDVAWLDYVASSTQPASPAIGSSSAFWAERVKTFEVDA